MEDTRAGEKTMAEGPDTPERAARQARLERWLEIISAVLLSLATVASAWCAYQSAGWNGVQAVSFSAANGARTESVRMSNTALQLTSIDVSMFVQFAAAYSEDNQFLVEFLYQRFRPEMKPALDAWIATQPLKNPDAPSSPFAMEEYKSAAQDESDRLLAEAEQKLKEADQANQQSDSYILLTVMFASVLFFGGVSTKFEAFRIRAGLIAFAAIVFALKAGLGVGGAIEGWLLGAYGYVPNVAQSAHALLGIRLIAGVYPAITFVICAVCLLFYGIGKHMEVEMTEELAERRKAFAPTPKPQTP